MSKTDFEGIIKRSLSFKYTSMNYLDSDDLSGYTVVHNDENLILLLGFDSNAGLNKYQWACNDIKKLFENMPSKNNILMQFIPEEHVSEFKRNGFSVRSIMHDYFLVGLDDYIFRNSCEPEFLVEKDCKQASDVTKQCRDQSRGFYGETEDFFRYWIGENNNDVKHAAVVINRESDGQISGVVCTGLYGFDSPNGATVWIREVAVNPNFQNRGIARKLIMQALEYGKNLGARKAFLQADEENEKAIHLYTSIGFAPDMGQGQIDMVKYN